MIYGRKIDAILTGINDLKKEIAKMSVDFSAEQAAIAALANVVTQAVTAIQGMANNISEAVKAEDADVQAKVDGFVAQINAQVATMNQALSATNVVTTPTPPASN